MAKSASLSGQRVGVVGLGNLGLAVALRLNSVGVDVSGFDINPQRAAAEGLHMASSVKDLAEWADIVLVLVSDASQCTAVISGENGITSASNPPSAVVVMSTIGPDSVVTMSGSLLEVGAVLIDVPVSGGAQAALNGELSLMAGGAVEDIAGCRRFLDKLGTVHLLGGLGAGQSAKLANQIVFFGTQASLQEAMDLADADGVDRDALLGALSGGTADCWSVRHWGFLNETARAYDAAGVAPSSRSWHKDLTKAAQVAANRGLEAPVTKLIARVFGDRVDRDARQK